MSSTRSEVSVDSLAGGGGGQWSRPPAAGGPPSSLDRGGDGDHPPHPMPHTYDDSAAVLVFPSLVYDDATETPPPSSADGTRPPRRHCLDVYVRSDAYHRHRDATSAAERHHPDPLPLEPSSSETTTTTTTTHGGGDCRQQQQRRRPPALPGVRREHRTGGQPVVVYLHGGAWLFGQRDMHNSQSVCHNLARAGPYVAISVSYTLTSFSNASLTSFFLLYTTFLGVLGTVSPFKQKAYLMTTWLLLTTVLFVLMYQRPAQSAQHPCHVNDACAALAWVRRNVHRYGGDPERLIIVGHSAGAHLAALLATNPDYLQRHQLSPRHLTAAVCLSGVYNDRELANGGIIPRTLLSETFGTERRQHLAAFPLHHMHPSVCPPLLLCNAGRDVSLKRHAKAFRSQLLQHGIYCDALTYPQVNHYTIVLNWQSENADILWDLLEFIDRAVRTRDSHEERSGERGVVSVVVRSGAAATAAPSTTLPPPPAAPPP